MENPYRMTVKEANSQLSFAIAVLKGEYGKNWCKNVGVALIIKERLLKEGYPWQSRRVENWIHRLQARQKSCLQPKRADSERAEEAPSSRSGILPYAKSTVSKSEEDPR